MMRMQRSVMLGMMLFEDIGFDPRRGEVIRFVSFGRECEVLSVGTISISRV